MLNPRFSIRAENRLLRFPTWMGKEPMAGRTWHKLEEQHMRKCIRAGCTIADVATNHGRSNLSILVRLRVCSRTFGNFIQHKPMDSYKHLYFKDLSGLWAEPTMPNEDTVEVKIEGKDLLDALSNQKEQAVEIKVSAEKAVTDAILNQQEWVKDELYKSTKHIYSALALTVALNVVFSMIAASVISN